MPSRLPSAKHFARLLCALAVSALCGTLHGQAQTTGGPVLLTEAGSTRAVALESVTHLRDPFSLDSPSAIGPDRRTRVVLFATNVDLYAGEGEGAFTA